MNATCPESERRRSVRRYGASALLAALVVAAGLTAPAAQAGPGEVELKTVFAAPVKATTGANATESERISCTPEPAGRLAYGTHEPFDQTRASEQPGTIGAGYPGSTNPQYQAANIPSSANLTQVTDAGAVNDLCFGFTLTPNMQPDFVRTAAQPNASAFRLADPQAPFVDKTAVGMSGPNPVDGDDMKTVTIDLPRGFVGDVDGAPTCSNAQFGSGNFLASTCPANSQVGTGFVRISTMVVFPSSDPQNPFTLPSHLATGGSPNGANPFRDGVAYNLEHGPNELGRIGVTVQPVAGIAASKFVVRFVFAPDGSGRIRTITENAPRRVYMTTDIDEAGQPKPNALPGPLYVESLGVRAWGKKADHPTLTKDFAEWGTDCTNELKADAQIETYGGVKSTMSSPGFKLTGCAALPFLPSVKVETTEKRPSVPTGAAITVGVGQTTTGPKSALLKDASVTLPTGLEVGAQIASKQGGLPLCSAAAFAFGDHSTPSTCPAGSEAATVTIVSPLQARPFVGKAYLGEQAAVGELPSLYVEATPEGATAADAPRIKLKGAVTVDGDGRITTAFKDAPQLRFSSLKLTFPSGPNAFFVTPRACGQTKGSSQFTSWAGQSVAVESSLDITDDCGPTAFQPSFAFAPQDNTVGASSPTNVTIARNDRAPWLKDIKVSLPNGFLSDLKAASECPGGDALNGNCPESSRIGTVKTKAGVGDAPYELTGSMFLAERGEGAVAGAVIVVRAKIGDIDLGDVVVPARIDLRPTDAGLTLSTTTPTRFRGLALNLRTVEVSLDRQGFALNPTACGPLEAKAELTADDGQQAAPTSQVTYQGCGARGLKPELAIALSGESQAKGHPTLEVKVRTRPGDSNLKSTKVTLPDGIAADINNVQVKCPTEAFYAGGCPGGTRVGSATARVSITNDVITGDVFLVQVPGLTLPGLGMSFGGRYTTRVLSSVKSGPGNRLITEFANIPDLPLTQLDLKVDGGAKSPLILAKACTADTKWDAAFGGQGGQSYSTSVTVPCDSVVKSSGVAWSRKTGLKLTLTAPTGKTYKSTKLSLPTGFKLTKSKAKQKKNIKFAVSGGKAKTKISTTSLSTTASGAGPKKVKLTLRTSAYTLPKSYKKQLKKGKKIKIKLRTVTNDGKVATSTITVKVK